VNAATLRLNWLCFVPKNGYRNI